MSWKINWCVVMCLFMTIKQDVHLPLSSLLFSVTVITLHCLYCIICYSSADPLLGLGGHRRQQELHREAGHCQELNHSVRALAALGFAGFILGQGIKVVLFSWEHWQWGIFKAI